MARRGFRPEFRRCVVGWLEAVERCRMSLRNSKPAGSLLYAKSADRAASVIARTAGWVMRRSTEIA